MKSGWTWASRRWRDGQRWCWACSCASRRRFQGGGRARTLLQCCYRWPLCSSCKMPFVSLNSEASASSFHQECEPPWLVIGKPIVAMDISCTGLGSNDLHEYDKKVYFKNNMFHSLFVFILFQLCFGIPGEYENNRYFLLFPGCSNCKMIKAAWFKGPSLNVCISWSQLLNKKQMPNILRVNVWIEIFSNQILLAQKLSTWIVNYVDNLFR